MSPGLLRAQWTAAPGVRAACTLRSGGVSPSPYASLNLGSHVGDDVAAVAENRRRVAAALDLPAEPMWLQQAHGIDVADADARECADASPGPCDAAITRRAGRVLAILVADCMPVLLASEDGAVLAAAHAGWRGLAAGVIEATIAAMDVAPARIRAWLGPAISARHFEVGDEVRAAFVAQATSTVQATQVGTAFSRNTRARWQCDLELLARARLGALGVTQVWSAGLCTYAHEEQCFSYRRDGRTGRMAALIWR